jgi:NADPH2:quinone reductase
MRTGHAWRAERFGEPGDVLKWLPTERPDPAPGRVLVQVRAVGVGLPDRLMVTNHYRLAAKPPVAPGQEVCGTVVAVAGGPDKLAFCTAAGAHHTVDHRGGDVGGELVRLTGGRGVDVLFDPVGGELARAAVLGLRPGGQVAVIGYASGSWIDVPAAELVMRNQSLVGVFTGVFTEDVDRAINAHLAQLVGAGQLATQRGPTYRTHEVARVLQELGPSSPPGKMIVERDQPWTSV